MGIRNTTLQNWFMFRLFYGSVLTRSYYSVQLEEKNYHKMRLDNDLDEGKCFTLILKT
jgi:hypothetical protein